MKNLWMPTWLAMASLCLLCSFTMPQIEDLGTATIIIDEDIMLTSSGNSELDIIRATLISPNHQYPFGGCNHSQCGYDISTVSTGVYTAFLHFEDGSEYKQGVIVE
jgi:hypothetical protein